jgi:VAD1 Analog of StAR-related lipid transfer domain
VRTRSSKAGFAFSSPSPSLTSMCADIQISDWAPIPADQNCLARNMSYIKRLNGSIGPKSTKCEIRDETLHCDFDDYVVTLTTTRTPDVPSGGVFSVKTRTCITWASSASSHIVVTSQVEWTGRSFIKGARVITCPSPLFSPIYPRRLQKQGSSKSPP